jgi:hypothetical protein
MIVTNLFLIFHGSSFYFLFRHKKEFPMLTPYNCVTREVRFTDLGLGLHLGLGLQLMNVLQPPQNPNLKLSPKPNPNPNFDPNPSPLTLTLNLALMLTQTLNHEHYFDVGFLGGVSPARSNLIEKKCMCGGGGWAIYIQDKM